MEGIFHKTDGDQIINADIRIIKDSKVPTSG